MPNGNINPFSLPAQILLQSPSRTGLGALAKALGGLSAGLGSGFERKRELERRDILSQLTQQLLGGQPQGQPTAIGQALTGQPALQQPLSPTQAIPPATPSQPPQVGGIDPALINRLTQLNPALGFQLAQGLRNQRIRQQELTQERQFELQQQVAEMVEARLKEQREFGRKKVIEEFKTELKFRGAPTGQFLQADTNLASQIGVPSKIVNPFKGLTREGAEKAQLEDQKAANTFVQSQQENFETSKNVLNAVFEAEGLIGEVATNPLFGVSFFGAKPFEFLKRMTSLDADALARLSDKLTPMMRQGMPGAASDRDVAMFRGATIGLGKFPETNQRALMALKIQFENFKDRMDFMNNYIDIHRTKRGAETAWKEYLDNNRIVKNRQLELNENRMSSKQWFAYINAGLNISDIKKRFK
jgi:hypothetical protein